MRLFVGNYKGPKGEQGPQGQKGNTGDIGQRGSRCTSGTSVTGTSTTGTIFASTGITDSLLHDFYINTSTGNLYECTVPGPADVAKWTYICNIKGPTGATGPAGPTGSISDINNQKPTYTEAATLANISSGETVKIAFGKLKKAISVLMTHYTKQATAAVLGHVKLSNSAAVTQTGLMALDAVEKNAAIAGTLANQISQANSNLANKIGLKLKTETLTCSAGIIRNYTFPNLPTHNFSFPIISSCSLNYEGVAVGRNVIEDGSIWVYSPVSQDIIVYLVVFT